MIVNQNLMRFSVPCILIPTDAHTLAFSFSVQVEETPFSLCVVIPIGSTFLELPELSLTFPTPERDVYHRIDVANISQSLNLCQHIGHNAVMSELGPNTTNFACRTFLRFPYTQYSKVPEMTW